MSKKKKKVANLAKQDAKKSMNRNDRQKQKRAEQKSVEGNNNQKRTSEKGGQRRGLVQGAEKQNDQRSVENKDKKNEKVVKNDQRSVVLIAAENLAEAKRLTSKEGEKEAQEAVSVSLEEDLAEERRKTAEKEKELEKSVEEELTTEPPREEAPAEPVGEEKTDAVEGILIEEDALEEEIPEVSVEDLQDEGESKRRHKLFPVVWWVLGALVLVAAIGGGFWATRYFTEKANESGEVAENPEEKPEEPEEKPEENESSDPPEPEEPEKPAEEPPTDEKPVEPPVENNTTGGELEPIAPRPGNTEHPEVVPGEKLIALTFDDGPSATTTPRLLDILAGRGVKATFFVLGNMAERAPGVVQREAADGHEVASHTPYHDNLVLLSAAQVRAQALEMDRIFTNILGTVPPFTRPPYGEVNGSVREALGQPLIMWSIDPKDWQDRNAAIVCSRVVGAAFDGAIILVHDIHATTVDAVPCIIDNLRSQGYEFLTVSELAAARDVPLVNGQLYYSFK